MHLDLLAQGEHLGDYRVLERQRMWAILEDPDGQRFRFWPTGKTYAEVSDLPPAATEEATLLSEEHRAERPLIESPEGEVAPEATPSPSQLQVDQASPAQASHTGDSDQVIVQPVHEDGESPAAEDGPLGSPAEADIAVAPADLTASAVPTFELDDTFEPPVAAGPGLPSEPAHLKHFTFLPASAVTISGIPGYREAERSEKFTGTEVRSLRALIEADPSGVDRPPSRLLGWLVQCAQAMKSAHEQGILVNSFTPDNLFVDFDPVTSKAERIAISTCLHAAPFAEAHRVAGYAPQGDEPLTAQADVYQIGTLLRDLLDWPAEQTLSGEPEALLDQPMLLVRLLLHLMHHQPEKRPDGAEALKKLLVETQQAFMTQHVLNVAGVTDTGLNREHNEDAFGYLQIEEQAGRGQLSSTVLVVCDGVGGNNAGEEASRLAVHEVLAHLSASAGTPLPVPQRLEAAILHANRKLLELSQERQGAGCTIVTVYVRGQEYWVAHAGDSRAYVCVDGRLQVLTDDHSWTAQQVRQGLLTPEEARNHENAHMIYRSLGERERLEVEIQPTTETGRVLEPGTVFLLCTDGVTDVLTDDQLRMILSSNSRMPRDHARHCVQAANAAGGPDNITALIATQEVSA